MSCIFMWAQWSSAKCREEYCDVTGGPSASSQARGMLVNKCLTAELTVPSRSETCEVERDCNGVRPVLGFYFVIFFFFFFFTFKNGSQSARLQAEGSAFEWAVNLKIHFSLNCVHKQSWRRFKRKSQDVSEMLTWIIIVFSVGLASERAHLDVAPFWLFCLYLALPEGLSVWWDCIGWGCHCLVLYRADGRISDARLMRRIWKEAAMT